MIICIPDLKQLKLYAISSPKLRPQEAGVLKNVSQATIKKLSSIYEVSRLQEPH